MDKIKKLILLIGGGAAGTPGGGNDALLLEDGSSGILLGDGSDIRLEYSASPRLLYPSSWSDQQFEYVQRDFGIMFCFNMPTFQDVQIGDPTTDPDVFNPSSLSINQWLDAAQAAGASYVVPVFKHPDGFCLWPSDAQPYNISESAWYASNGSPDLLAQFYENAMGRGLAVVPYVSVWDLKFELDNPAFTGAEYTAHTAAIMAEIKDRCPDAPAIWTDGWKWSPTSGYTVVDWEDIRAALYALWPTGLLAENAHEGTLAHTDIVLYEQSIDGDVAPNNIDPAESVRTIYQDGHWFKTSSSVISKTAAIVDMERQYNRNRYAAYLLSVGPETTGLLGNAEVTLLNDIGS